MERPIIVRLANHEDLAAWLELAADVEPLFGAMPDIAMHIGRGILRGTALVAEEADGRIAGAVLLSRDSQPHHIHWLAVRSDARRQGVGSSLLTTIIARWADGQPIDVITFGTDVPDGVSARALYAAHGFEYSEDSHRGPEGGSRERWIRHGANNESARI